MYLRKFPLIIALFSLAGLAFGVGYIAYPLLHPPRESVVVDPQTEGTAGAQGLDLQLFWEVRSLLERDFFGEKPSEDAQRYGTVRGLVQAYDDPYTYFVEPQPRELEQDNLRGSFGGIGAYIVGGDDGYHLSPMPGQPAEQAGIQEGDLLLLVDDTEITTEMSEEDVVALVRGPVDTDVVLVVRRGQDDAVEELTIAVTRAVIETPSVDYRLLDDDPRTADIGYIKHTLFTERSPDEMLQAIQELTDRGATRFILDLRGNPGGIVNSAVAIADMWIDDGLIFTEERADGSREEFRATAGGPGVEYPLVVVVDAASASASEIVAGALQDLGRAQLVGEKTFGKGSVQFIHQLADASSLHVTTAEWFTSDGHQLTGVGLTPDRTIEPGADPLPAAVALLMDQPLPAAATARD